MEGKDSEAALPPDYQNTAELILGRLMYPSVGRGGRGGRGGGNWLNGGTNWTVDYPRGDRTFSVAIRRLTRIDVRSVEQPVNPDDDDIFLFPYMHAGMPTNWSFTEAQAAKIREYLLRGGFLVCDSFFGTQEWEGFRCGMRQIFPDREITEMPDDDPIFTLRFQRCTKNIRSRNFRSMLRNGNTYRADGSSRTGARSATTRGRIMVAINFNNDFGDSWQLADDPRYPEKYFLSRHPAGNQLRHLCDDALSGDRRFQPPHCGHE